MPELSKRIAELSPERRALLDRLAGTHRSSVANVTTRVPAEVPVTNGAGPEQESRRFFDRINRQLNHSEVGQFSWFLNYGYVPDSAPQFAAVTLPEYFLNKNSVRLVLELIGDCDLRGKRVLDVGCGRGGAIHVINRFFEASAVTGVDLSAEAVRFCHGTHRYPNVCFLEADAQRLPFAGASFDVVLNIESSDSYPAIYTFYAEVFRVLAPGGYFLYTDMMPVSKFSEVVRLQHALGFELQRDRDISQNVLASCDEMALRNLQAFGGGDPTMMSEFLAVPGSQVYEDLRSGRSAYRMFKLRKP